MSDLEFLRECYYSINIGKEQEFVWIKKLRNILNSDIHNRPLGCKINDTHIKIGDVHLGSFYEAQLLFSHSKWIHRFAEWLSNEMSTDTCLIVGYETYIEPVLSVLHNTRNIDYCIYEEPKYIQRNTMSKARLRYSENINKIKKEFAEKYKKIVFLCGISSTLSTYFKLKNAFEKEWMEDISGIEFEFYSIIQVLPQLSLPEAKFILNDSDELTWNKSQKKVCRKNISVTYLVDVECEWQRAQTCKWCFPKSDILEERPVITTGDSSVIPLQMIGSNELSEIKSKTSINNDNFDFFEKENDIFKYQEYLYYNHIDRDDHHFQYYIRTGALFNNIMDSSAASSFVCFCEKIKSKLALDENSINIIVTPLHFSNERLSHEINRLVFDNKAHIISFDSRKEYRSNFETKYSNYAYVLDQITSPIKLSNNVNLEHKINFYFVDDQLITGNTFYRAKSFVSSLMRRYSQTSKNYNVFSAVITLIDRNSVSTKMNYTNNMDSYFSFINLPIPSIRNYGDSCPLCKQIIDAENISNNCTLDVVSKYWSEKARYHKEKTIEEAKQLYNKTDNKIINRHFIRFYCECVLWKKTKNLWDEQSILDGILRVIYDEIKLLEIIKQYEYLMSFLKVVSRPFLYYRENIKKAVLKLLLLILTELLNGEILPSVILEKTINHSFSKGYIKNNVEISHASISKKVIPEQIKFERYCLVCIVISCLSNIESSYLLNIDHITNLCEYVSAIDSTYTTFDYITYDGKTTINGFYSIVVNNFKKLICGISGYDKSRAVEKHLMDAFSNKYSQLFKVLYLENIRFSSKDNNISQEIENIQNTEKNTICKYERIGEICKESSNSTQCLFFLVYGNDLKNSRIAEIFGNTQMNSFDCILQKINYDINKSNELINSLNTIGYFEFEYKHFLIVLDGDAENNEAFRDKKILMLISFNNSNSQNYTSVKKWLIHRKKIKCLINDDIKTGALESAILAKAAEYVLSTDKTQSHGQSNDINKLYKFVYDKFISVNNKQTINLISAYQGINLFVNRCIAFGATKQIFQEYFELSNNQHKLQPFCSCIQKLDDIHASDAKRDLNRYFDTILEKDSEYINEIKKEVFKKREIFNKKLEEQNVTITMNPSNSDIDLKYVPVLIDLPYPLINNVIFLIGIIDVFVRNAIEHGSENCKITINIAVGDSVIQQKQEGYDYSNSYSISVLNEYEKKDESNNQEGFTKRFFTQYLSNERDKHSYFCINMVPKTKNVFESKITCVVKELLEE